MLNFILVGCLNNENDITSEKYDEQSQNLNSEYIKLESLDNDLKYIEENNDEVRSLNLSIKGCTFKKTVLLGKEYVCMLCSEKDDNSIFAVEFKSHEDALYSLEHLKSNSIYFYNVYKNILFLSYKWVYAYLDNFVLSGDVFYSQDMKTLISVPDHYKEFVFPEGVENICSLAFEYSNIEYVKLNKEMKNIGSGAFYGCTQLKTVILNEGLEIIDLKSFLNCSVLETLVIPSTVKYIGSNAFEYGSIYIKHHEKPLSWPDNFYFPISSDEKEEKGATVYWGNQWMYDDNGVPVVKEEKTNS